MKKILVTVLCAFLLTITIPVGAAPLDLSISFGSWTDWLPTPVVEALLGAIGHESDPNGAPQSETDYGPGLDPDGAPSAEGDYGAGLDPNGQP